MARNKNQNDPFHVSLFELSQILRWLVFGSLMIAVPATATSNERYWYKPDCTDRFRASILDVTENDITLRNDELGRFAISVNRLSDGDRLYIEAFRSVLVAKVHLFRSPYATTGTALDDLKNQLAMFFPSDDPPIASGKLPKIENLKGRWVEINGAEYQIVAAVPSQQVVGISQLILRMRKNDKFVDVRLRPYHTTSVTLLPDFWRGGNASDGQLIGTPFRFRAPRNVAVVRDVDQWKYQLVFDHATNVWTDVEAAEAYRLFEKAIVQNESSMIEGRLSDSRWHIHHGDIESKRGEYVSAIDHFSKAIQSTPRMLAAYYKRAACYSETTEFTRAISDFSVVIASQGKNTEFLADSLLGRAEAESKLNLHDAAILDVAQAGPLSKDRPTRYDSVRNDVHTQATKFFEEKSVRIIKHCNDNLQSLLDSDAELHEDVGAVELAKAIEFANKAVRCNIDSAQTGRLLSESRNYEILLADYMDKRGAVFAGRNRYSLAVLYEQQAVKRSVDPKNKRAYEERLSQYRQELERQLVAETRELIEKITQALKAGNFSRAIKLSEMARSLVPPTQADLAKECTNILAESHGLRARQRQEDGYYAEALADLDAARSLIGKLVDSQIATKVECHYQLARQANQKGDLERASQQLRECLHASPNHVEANDLFKVVAAAQEKRERIRLVQERERKFPQFYLHGDPKHFYENDFVRFELYGSNQQKALARIAKRMVDHARDQEIEDALQNNYPNASEAEIRAMREMLVLMVDEGVTLEQFGSKAAYVGLKTKFPQLETIENIKSTLETFGDLIRVIVPARGSRDIEIEKLTTHQILDEINTRLREYTVNSRIDINNRLEFITRDEDGSSDICPLRMLETDSVTIAGDDWIAYNIFGHSKQYRVKVKTIDNKKVARYRLSNGNTGDSDRISFNVMKHNVQRNVIVSLMRHVIARAGYTGDVR